MEKIVFIKNRSKLNLSIKLNIADNRSRLVFLEHGLGARKDYPHMAVLEKVFAEHGYNVVNIDACDSNNESDKSESGITFSGHYADLEDTIQWAKTQSFYREPFSLAGQSMGAVACTLFASMFPNKVDFLLTANLSWLNGKFEANQNKRRDEILKTGFYKQVSKSTGKSFLIRKNYLDDLEKYDLSENIKNIKAKTAIVVGLADSEYHINNNENFYNQLTCDKKMIKLQGIPHDLANTSEHAKIFAIAVSNALD